MKYRFAACSLDTDRHVFERAGQVVHIEPQVFDLLHLLVRSAGDLVTHDTLIASVWQGLIVSDASISARINAARKAVGDSGKAQKTIETVARRGFRLIAPVEVEAPSPTGAMPFLEPWTFIPRALEPGNAVLDVRRTAVRTT